MCTPYLTFIFARYDLLTLSAGCPLVLMVIERGLSSLFTAASAYLTKDDNYELWVLVMINMPYG